jgi:hypothetical protein
LENVKEFRARVQCTRTDVKSTAQRPQFVLNRYETCLFAEYQESKIEERFSWPSAIALGLGAPVSDASGTGISVPGEPEPWVRDPVVYSGNLNHAKHMQSETIIREGRHAPFHPGFRPNASQIGFHLPFDQPTGTFMPKGACKLR